MSIIELTISGSKCYNFGKSDIAYLLATQKILSTVINTMSSIDYKDDNFKIEPGYKIYLYNVTKENFVSNVWKPLSDLLEIECGHIRTDSYIGCINNWPGVMTESKCVINK